VALLLLARMLNDRAAGGPAQQAATRATSILGELLAELRRIARGIYPAVVADSGLAAALEDLADTSLDVVVDVRCESLGQFDDSVATTAYLVCAAALADARSGEATQMDISATRTDGLLAIAVEDDSRTDHEVTVGRLVDRVVALSGSLSCSGDPTGYRLLLELPCAS
jgi:signal transduction histidine kinase